MTEQQIGRYQIQATLGSGAMGTVYKAYDPVIKRTVAIKIIKTDQISNDNDRDAFETRFFREAQISGQLHHPSIVTVYDLGEHQQMPFIVMEFVEGRSLIKVMEKSEILTKEFLIRIHEQIADALESAHAQQITHRDIKPHNIMITEKGDAKILDFGIAKIAGTDLTVEGEYLGTPSYSSPEQISEEHIDHRSDIFSFAVVSLRLLTNCDPFAASTLKQIFFRIIYGDPTIGKPFDHLAINQNVFHQIYKKALAKEPDERFQSAKDFALEVIAVIKGHSSVQADTELVSDDLSLESIELLEDDMDEATKTIRNQLKSKVGIKKDPQETRTEILRNQFSQAAQTQNTMACKTIIEELIREGVDPIEEKSTLNDLESTQKRKELQEQIVLKKTAFHQLVEEGRLEEASTLLKNLRAHNVDVAHETKCFLHKQREQEALIHKKEKDFDKTFMTRDLGKARAYLRDLKKLGADTQQKEVLLKKLEKSKMLEAQNKMKELNQVRENFTAAVAAKDLKKAVALLNRLKETKANFQKEAGELEKLKEQLSKDKEDEVSHLFANIRHELKKKNPELAHKFFKKLSTITPKERQAELKSLEKKVAKAMTAFEKKKMKMLLAEFEEAIEKNHTSAAHRAQETLASMDCSHPLYKWLLAKARGKDPGPRPKERHWLLSLIIISVCILGAVALWYFLGKS